MLEHIYGKGMNMSYLDDLPTIKHGEFSIADWITREYQP